MRGSRTFVCSLDVRVDPPGIRFEISFNRNTVFYCWTKDGPDVSLPLNIYSVQWAVGVIM